MSLRDRIRSALTPEPFTLYPEDRLLARSCDDPDRCSSFWRDMNDRAQADADRYANQLMRLGIRPEPLLDEYRDGNVVAE